MTIEQLDKAHRAQPFRPFLLHIADGRTVPVRHPEMLARTQGGRTILIGLEGENYEVIDLLLVTGIEVTNGAKRGRPRRR